MPKTGDYAKASGTFRCTSCDESIDMEQDAQFPECFNESSSVEWEEVLIPVTAMAGAQDEEEDDEEERLEA